MTLQELLSLGYSWIEVRAEWVLLCTCAIPIVGTLAAWIGKGGRTDRDGRHFANLLIGFGLLVLAVEVTALVVAHLAFGTSIFEANVTLLIAPVICLLGSLIGIHWIFPLAQLGSVRTFKDVGLFILTCGAVFWFFASFRGWGVVFFGGIVQLIIICVLAFFLLRRLFKRISR